MIRGDSLIGFPGDLGWLQRISHLVFYHNLAFSATAYYVFCMSVQSGKIQDVLFCDSFWQLFQNDVFRLYEPDEEGFV